MGEMKFSELFSNPEAGKLFRLGGAALRTASLAEGDRSLHPERPVSSVELTKESSRNPVRTIESGRGT